MFVVWSWAYEESGIVGISPTLEGAKQIGASKHPDQDSWNPMTMDKWDGPVVNKWERTTKTRGDRDIIEIHEWPVEHVPA